MSETIRLAPLESPARSVSSLLMDPSDPQPIRGELFSQENLEAHARAIAPRLSTVSVRPGRPLLRRFHENERVLAQAHRAIVEACRRKEVIDTDAEWFLDNYHIIEDAVREVRVDLPHSYYAELPKLTQGLWSGLPRVYALALELIAHTDSSLNESNITRFVQAHQTDTALTIGELWAMPIMLRLGLLENLRRLADEMLRTWRDRQAADRWAAHLSGQADFDGTEAGSQPSVRWLDWWRRIVRHLSWQNAAPRSLSDPFVVRLLFNLRDRGLAAEAGVEWLESSLMASGVELADVLRRENQRQAANQVSVGNCVTSLRLLSALDWMAFFERTSHVEIILRNDPARVYAAQDFATRDRYRRVIERLARGSRRTEMEVAQNVLDLAHDRAADPRLSHIGFYLIDRGLDDLKSRVGYRPNVRETLRDAIQVHPYLFHFGLIGVVTAVLVGGTLLLAWTMGAGPISLCVLCFGALLPASEVAVGVVNETVTMLLPPRVLPKLALQEGVPSDCATFVVMPAMLLDARSVVILLERLEVHYLSNPEANLYFALLTDFADAPAEQMPEDNEYLGKAVAAVRDLNARYGGAERFFLFHRRRIWNPVQRCWMGWERKRGKLLEFNRLLRGDRDTTFTTISGNLDALPRIRFCVTLDADTKLPRDAVRRLIGVLAHPLNRPRFDGGARRVVEGYGVLQPRISFGLTGAARSRFAHIFSGSAGVDPYTTAVSDVYQDLFGVGSYTGKGIYEIDSFEAAVGDAFPENRILSHDLIEGNHARCGLVSDIELFDDFPARYDAYARREHRWVRGDWQILPWLFPMVPASAGKRPNPLPFLERWKIFDNLRRSLVPPALVALLVLGWTVLPGPPWVWTLLGASVLVLPLVLRLVSGVIHLVAAPSFGRIRQLRGDIGNTAAQVLLGIVFLADQARLMLDAIVRTLVRLFITHRNLLEWESAAATELRLRSSGVWKMWPTCVIAICAASVVALVRPTALMSALPLLVAWFVSPAVAWWVSRPLVLRDKPLNEEERRELRRIARKTWSFFETFVGDEDHWLPPDNFQEDPKGQVAHRTSPTNLGMLLASTLAAYDFGYLTLSRLLDRLEKTFASLEQLERFNGHLYNWYDTRALRPMQPGYISTVDSGNLLGCLVALKHGLLERAQAPLPNPSIPAGLADTIHLVAEALEAIERPEAVESPADFQSVEATITEIERCLAGVAESPRSDAPRNDVTWGGALGEVDRLAADLLSRVNALAETIGETPEDLDRWSRRFADQARDARGELALLTDSTSFELVRRCEQLAERSATIAKQMDFGFLYNEQRHLFSVGYNVALGRLDNAHYDLLASEAALASLLAVARGDADTKHWFQMGRPLTRASGSIALISWGGTMFEYLMPRLLLRSFPETLLDRSYRAAVARQIEYGRQRRVPWGISESAFGALDANRDYQYQSFGAPGLGLKRGLADDLVVAPYATALALAVKPHDAVRNFQRLAAEGADGSFGFYEAIDYSRSRLPEGQRSLVVRSFMAHHQGMTLVALANGLFGEIMPRRFHTEPMVRATELLLQERVPRAPSLVQPHTDEAAAKPVIEGPHPMSRRLVTPDTPGPRAHLISNGRYNVMLTNAGSGYSTCRGLDVTRWREDRTRDHWGQFCYIQDAHTGTTWAAGHQPICREPQEYEVIYSVDKAEFRRIDDGIGTNWEVTVAPDHNAEVRRLSLVNHHIRPRELELTSYAEIVLGPRAADLAHPAFGKLFLETEFVAEHGALLCRRRPRAPEQKPIWAVHVIAVDDANVAGELEYETERSRFIGRCRTLRNPAALERYARLSNSTGAVLDPIVSLRRRVRVPAGASVSVAFTTAVADSHDEALLLADQYHDFHAVSRAFELAWAHSQVELRHLKLNAEDAHVFQRLVTHILYAGPNLRAMPAVQLANHQGQPGLWRYGISGDFPIVLVRISEIDELRFVQQLLAAHAYWRFKGVEVDLVILCDEATSYFEELYQQVQTLVRTSDSHALADKPGGVFVRKGPQIPDEDKVLLQSAARVVLTAGRGSLRSQVDRTERTVPLSPRFVSSRTAMPQRRYSSSRTPASLPPNLLFANGLGGFTPGGREYVIRLDESATTPAPWINVVANPSFGFLVSESGSGYTWAGNSQTNRLTSWSNDPVCDSPGEAIYLRDEDSGEIWSPTPLPVRAREPYLVRHGQGYSTFEHHSHDLQQQLCMFVPVEDPIKLISLKVRNDSAKSRRLSATFYAEWVLGTVREQAPMSVITELDEHSGAVLARNSFNSEFGSRVAFADVSIRPRTFTADRAEFFGRNGSVAEPESLRRVELSGRVGCNLDPCLALQGKFELRAGEEKTVIFALGQAADLPTARQLISRYTEARRADAALAAVQSQWDRVLGAVQVETPNQALDLMLNRWLLYQSLACRVWARSAFYQSGGAYGFRDQLQDVMALVYGAPEESRAHVLRAASRQFVEGDVQHWWHPPAGRGVRTRFSDDYLWLPYVTCHYVTTTGDFALLDERVPFLQAPTLKPDQEDDFRLPDTSEESGTIYEHCVRAIEHGLRFGERGLPLMGTGDWNDGMNRVGHGGKGESVWVGWFLLTCLRQFAELVATRGDTERAHRYRAQAEQLRGAIEQHGWDGRWYLRAYFDDGTPLGSAQNDECQIDSIVQSWAVLCGGAELERARQAMTSVEELLVRPSAHLIRLLTPPFDQGKLQPGYIKGYVPGIRENGGQYTHAATWVVQATALLGQGSRAMELFDLLNPIVHSATPADLARYKVEPYVVVADIYDNPQHIGRGGWTWYTGSASWLYRVALETLLGLQLRGSKLLLDPHIPRHWRTYRIMYRRPSSIYSITVDNPDGVEQGVRRVIVDGKEQPDRAIPLTDDGNEHTVSVIMGD